MAVQTSLIFLAVLLAVGAHPHQVSQSSLAGSQQQQQQQQQPQQLNAGLRKGGLAQPYNGLSWNLGGLQGLGGLSGLSGLGGGGASAYAGYPSQLSSGSSLQQLGLSSPYLGGLSRYSGYYPQYSNALPQYGGGLGYYSGLNQYGNNLGLYGGGYQQPINSYLPYQYQWPYNNFYSSKNRQGGANPLGVAPVNYVLVLNKDSNGVPTVNVRAVETARLPPAIQNFINGVQSSMYNVFANTPLGTFFKPATVEEIPEEVETPDSGPALSDDSLDSQKRLVYDRSGKPVIEVLSVPNNRAQQNQLLRVPYLDYFQYPSLKQNSNWGTAANLLSSIYRQPQQVRY